MSSIPYPCLEEEDRPCRESCRKWMRSECDGRIYMLAADGSWMRNIILAKKRMEENKGKRAHPELLLSFIHEALPSGVKIVTEKDE